MDIEEQLRDLGDPDSEAESEGDGEATDSPESSDPLAERPELQKALLALYQKCSAEDRYPRLVEVKDVKQAEFYWQGRQYIWWSNQDKQWSTPTQAQNAGYGDLNVDDMPRFEFVTNIYQSRGLTIIGAIAGAPPKYRFFPDDADNEDDIETAAGRTKTAKLIERWNPPQLLLQQEGYHAYTGGFVCWHTYYLENGEKWGTDQVQMLGEDAEQPEAAIVCPQCGWSAPAAMAAPPVPCPQCGAQLADTDIVEEEPIPVPSDGGMADVPRGREVIEVYGALNCKRPQHVDEQGEYHYFAIEKEVHYGFLRRRHQDKADEIKAGMDFGPDDVYERNARLSVAENTKLLTQSGSKQQSLCTWARVWFRPDAFWMLDDKTERDELTALFPDGCYVEFAGTLYCSSQAQSMDDCLVTRCVMPGRGQHRNAVGTSTLSVQDRVNTLSNISAETYEYGIPITYRASDTFNAEADEDQRAAPGLEVEVMMQPGQDIRSKILQVRADSVSQDMQKHMMDLFGPISEDMSGALPALTGASESGPDTLGQQHMQRDQAMGRAGIFYVHLKQGHADIMTLACRDFENHADGDVKIPVLAPSGGFESETVDVSALSGDATAFPEGDENFPELWNQKRATFMQLLQTPYGQALTQEPDNLELANKLVGISDLKIPGIDDRHKALREIAEVVKYFSSLEAMGGGAPMSGPPMVDVDAEMDNHPVAYKTYANFLNSEQGQKLKREQPEAWTVIKQIALQHKQLIPPPKPPEKPPNETVNFKDLPPEAQAQFLEQNFGIKVSPQDFLAQIALEQAKKAPKAHPAPVSVAPPNAAPAPAPPQPAGNVPPPAAGA